MRSRTYHFQNNYSLVFQFIVSEYLAVCQALKVLESQLQHKHLENVKKILLQLIGTPEDQFHTFSVYSDHHLLIQLQKSCQYLAFQDEEENVSSVKLSTYAQKVYRLTYQAWKVFDELEPQSDHHIVQHLEIFIPKIQDYLRKMGRLISKLFLQFEDDETILLFLLQNHQALDEIYQTTYVKKLLSKMFDKGIHAAEIYVSKQYSKRGYHQLLSIISEASLELQQKK